MAERCYLKSLKNSNESISLPDNEEIILGRNKNTKIKSVSCSRKQISLKANYDEFKVDIKQLGINPSGFDGFSMIQNAIYKISHGARIEVLFNDFYYIVEFDPPPEELQNTENKKRKLESDVGTETPKIKCSKIEMGETQIIKTLEALENSWDNIDKGELYVFTSMGVKPSDKIAAFDMDGTLITPKSGKVHPENIEDWKITFSEVKRKLKEQIDNGFKVVILSNQAPIGKGRVKIDDFKMKIESIIAKIQVPIQAFIATGKGIYRKPATGMWKILLEQKNCGLKVNMAESFYCGDAAGRSNNWGLGKKKDHSMADKLLAENLGLKFYTPEQFFLGHSIANIPFDKPLFNPKEVAAVPFDDNLIKNEKEILVLVGFPGSGKSFLAKQIEKLSNNKYVAVCRDKLGSWQKCASEGAKLLQQGKSVIIDSTNPDVESRKRWTSLAQTHNVHCRCVKMETTFAHSQHNNKYRELKKVKHLPVNDIVFHTYKKNFKEPTISEGFKEVINAKFNPHFEDKSSEELYRMHLLEK